MRFQAKSSTYPCNIENSYYIIHYGLIWRELEFVLSRANANSIRAESGP